jgi:hypothetical protein
MLHFSDTSIEKLVMHRVGNKSKEEEILIARRAIKTESSVSDLLLKYFLSPFKSREFYNLHHESDLQLNEVYNYVSQIFDDPDNIYIQSVNLAKHLYEQSTHPKVKGGEFYVVYFSGITMDDDKFDAVGLFKSELKETFLRVMPTDDNFKIEYEDGININNLDKGCLIINSEKERGYIVAVVDNLSRAGEAQFWRDDFLKIKQREDQYFQTENLMRICHQFVTEKLPEQYDINRADQAELLTKSAKFMKSQDEFVMGEFTDAVFKQPEIKESFQNFTKKYEEEMDFELPDNFQIADEAVKKQSKFFKSVNKLDKNFHVYINGTRERVVKGYDEERGLSYYQLFFDTEI